VGVGEVVREATSEEIKSWSEDTSVEDGVVFEPLSLLVKDRMWKIIERVPVGKVITYRQLVDYTGAPPGFMRSIPANMKKWILIPGNPCHRIVDTKMMLPKNKEEVLYCADQVARLNAEGLEIDSKGRIVGDEADFKWAPTHKELFLKGAN